MLSRLCTRRTRSVLSPSAIARFSSASEGPVHHPLDEQLLVFPEYKEVLLNLPQGKLKASLPLCERVHASLTQALGGASPLSRRIALVTSDVLTSLGERERARAWLQTHREQFVGDAAAAEPSAEIEYLQRLARNTLLSSNESERECGREVAVQLAEQCVQRCEDGGAAVDFALFSPSYTLLGLSYLAAGDVDEAETFFQLAARWAQNPYDQLVALNNKGALSFYKLAQEGSFDLWQHYLDEIQQNVRITPAGNTTVITTTVPAGKGADNADSVKVHKTTAQKESKTVAEKEQTPVVIGSASPALQSVNEAMHCWTEALTEANNQGTQKPSAADAMCGPTSGVNTNLGVTGLGDKERRVSSPSVSESPAPVLHYNGTLRNVHYANAYATLLCNLAEAHALTGNTSAASDHLSSALKALNRHEADVRSHPYLARPLRMIATSHMKASQAVTAEGLFRAGLDKLQHTNEYQFRHESALIKGFYGQLLCKWEKREALGETYRGEAKSFLQAHIARKDSIGLTAPAHIPHL